MFARDIPPVRCHISIQTLDQGMCNQMEHQDLQPTY